MILEKFLNKKFAKKIKCHFPKLGHVIFRKFVNLSRRLNLPKMQTKKQNKKPTLSKRKAEVSLEKMEAPKKQKPVTKLEPLNTSTALSLISKESDFSKKTRSSKKDVESPQLVNSEESGNSEGAKTFREQCEILRGGLKNYNINDLALLEPVEQEDELLRIYGVSRAKDALGRVYFSDYVKSPGQMKPEKLNDSFRWTSLFVDLSKAIPSSLGCWTIGKVANGDNIGKYWKAVRQHNGELVKNTFQWIKSKLEYKRLKRMQDETKEKIVETVRVHEVDDDEDTTADGAQDVFGAQSGW